MARGAYDFNPKHSNKSSACRLLCCSPAAAKPVVHAAPAFPTVQAAAPRGYQCMDRGRTWTPWEMLGSCLLGTFGISSKPWVDSSALHQADAQSAKGCMWIWCLWDGHGWSRLPLTFWDKWGLALAPGGSRLLLGGCRSPRVLIFPSEGCSGDV